MLSHPCVCPVASAGTTPSSWTVAQTSPAMERIVALTQRNGILILDLQTGATVGNLKGIEGCNFYGTTLFNTSPVFSLPSTPASLFLALTDATRSFLHIFRRDRPDAPCASFSVPEVLRALSFSSCGSLIVAGGQSGNIYCWDVASGILRRCWRGHYKSVTAVGITPDDAYMITAGSDGVVCLYAMDMVLDHTHPDQPMQPVRRWNVHSFAVVTVACAWLGVEEFAIVTGSTDRTVQILTPDRDNPVATLLLPASVRHVSINPVSLECYIACSDTGNRIYAYDLGIFLDPSAAMFIPFSLSTTTSAILPETHSYFEGHTSPVDCCCASSDGTALISCAADGLRVWDILSRQTTRHVSMLVGVAVITDALGKSFQDNDLLTPSKEGRSIRKKGACITGALPPCPMKPLQRVWGSQLTDPCLVTLNPSSELQERFDSQFPSLRALRHGLPLGPTLLRSRLRYLQQFAGELEIDHIDVTLQKTKEERHEFGSIVCEMLDTLCSNTLDHATRATTERDDTSDERNEQRFYDSHLPVPPIDPVQAMTAQQQLTFPRETLITHHSRLFRYLDRTLATSTLPPQKRRCPDCPSELQGTAVSQYDSTDELVSEYHSSSADDDDDDDTPETVQDSDDTLSSDQSSPFPADHNEDKKFCSTDFEQETATILFDSLSSCSPSPPRTLRASPSCSSPSQHVSPPSVDDAPPHGRRQTAAQGMNPRSHTAQPENWRRFPRGFHTKRFSRLRRLTFSLRR